jgi:hypothetical protein
MHVRIKPDKPSIHPRVVPGMDDLSAKVSEWPLVCSQCRRRGTVTLDGRDAIATSGGFYLGMKHPGDRGCLIACSDCGTIHPYPP